ncbi:unnamed protein product [Amoebophrya sp. A120]|nr:unnamed protein product [Amoebophrya sp. A120]|eukprot:GSA120T00006279001.1
MGLFRSARELFRVLHLLHCAVRTVCNKTTLELLQHVANAAWNPEMQDFELHFDTFGPYDEDDDAEWERREKGSSGGFAQVWIPAGYSTTRRTESWDEFRHAASRDGRPAEGSSTLEVVQTTKKRAATSSRGRHLHSDRRKEKHHHDKRSKRRKSRHVHKEQDAEHQERKKATKTHHVVPTVDDGSRNATENSGPHEGGGAAGGAGGEKNGLQQARPTSRKEKDVQLLEKTTQSHDGETPKSSAEMRHTQDDERENRNKSRAERGGAAASDRPGQNSTRGMSSQLALKNKNAPAARKKRHGKRGASASGVGKRSGGRGAEDRPTSIRERRGDRFEFLQTRADEKKAELKAATSPAPVAGLDHRLGRARGDVRDKPADVTREDGAARSSSSDFLQTLSGKPTKNGSGGDNEEFLASTQQEDRTPVANEPLGIPVEEDELRVAEDEVPRVLQEGGEVKGRKAEGPECSFLSCSGGDDVPLAPPQRPAAVAGPRPGAATPPLGGAQSSNTGTPQGPTTTTIKLTLPPAHPGTSNTRPSGVDPAGGDPALTGGVAHPSATVSFRPKNEKTGVSGQLGCEFVWYGRDEEWHKTGRNFPVDPDWPNFPRHLLPHSLDLTKETLHLHPLNLLKPVDKRLENYKHNPLVFQSKWKGTRTWNSGGGRPPAQYKHALDEGFKSQNLVSQLIAPDIGIPAENIGLVVAGNSGLPGGGIAGLGPDGAQLKQGGIHANYDSQEESLVSNWIHYQVEYEKDHRSRGPRWIDPRILVGDLYASTIQNEWGLKNDHWADYTTIQGVNYRSTENPVDFSDCWVVRNTRIGDEERYRTPEGKSKSGYKRPGPDNKHVGEKIGGLFFASAPNAAGQRGDFGSTARTLNLRATDKQLMGEGPAVKEDVVFFLAGLEAAITGVIDAAIKEQLLFGIPISVLVFNPFGGGLYWPRQGDAFVMNDSGYRVAKDPKKREVRGPQPILETYKRIFTHVLDGTVSVQRINMEGEAFEVKKKFFFDHILVTGL